MDCRKSADLLASALTWIGGTPPEYLVSLFIERHWFASVSVFGFQIVPRAWEGDICDKKGSKQYTRVKGLESRRPELQLSMTERLPDAPAKASIVDTLKTGKVPLMMR